MSVRLHERIDICKTDRNGNITELQRASFGQGWIFKDWDAFHCHRDAPLLCARAFGYCLYRK